MKKIVIFALALSFILFSFSSCVTSDAEEQEPVVEEPETVQVEPVPEPEPEPEPEPVESEPEEFVVTEELYVTTFEDIQGIIANLNAVIASRDYNTWLTYLTDEYIEYYSDPEVLQKFTDLYKQRGYNYRINDLEDYFNYLVVISRANAVLDEIIFVDPTHVKALTELKGQLSVLYYLEKIENEWKIAP